MTSRIRVGAVGNARILKRYIAEREANPLIDFQMIATRSAVAAEKARQTYPEKIISQNYEDALVAKDLEAIYVCLPSGLHFTWAEKAHAATQGCSKISTTSPRPKGMACLRYG